MNSRFRTIKLSHTRGDNQGDIRHRERAVCKIDETGDLCYELRSVKAAQNYDVGNRRTEKLPLSRLEFEFETVMLTSYRYQYLANSEETTRNLLDGVGVTRVERPANDVGRVLDPVRASVSYRTLHY